MRQSPKKIPVSHIFNEWLKEQYIFQEVLLQNLQTKINNKHLEMLQKKILAKNITSQYLQALLIPVKPTGYTKQSLKKQLEKLYTWLQKDASGLFSHLKQTGLCTNEVNKKEEKEDIDKIINRYLKIFSYLLNTKNKQQRLEYFLVIANNFFEYCFSSKTFPAFKTMLKIKRDHPILRLIYSMMWSNLAQTGWQHWHANTIHELQKEAIREKEIVYIAGGTDIYQLIKHGIYNIRIIDPLLSSQPKYYAKDWQWFIKDDNAFHGVGDQIIIPINKTTLVMERVSYEESGKKFTAHLSTKKKEIIPESISIWKIFFKSQPKRILGHITIDRRFVAQRDFKRHKKQTLLISFNELFYVCAPKECYGWGIDVRKLNKNVKIYVKQLRAPVTKNIMKHMRYEAGQEDFCFIQLGTCVD